MELPDEVQCQLQEFASTTSGLCKDVQALLELLAPGSATELQPLQRAQVLLALSQAANALFALHGRAHGLEPSSQAGWKEGERLEAYNKKVSKAVTADELAKSKRGAVVNIAAAARVLDHAIADLSRQQKEQLRELSKSAAATAAPGSAGSGSSGAGAGAGSKRGASGAGAPAAAAGGASSKQQARAKRAKGAKDHAIEFLSQVLKDKETAMQANALGGDAAEAGATEDA